MTILRMFRELRIDLIKVRIACHAATVPKIFCAPGLDGFRLQQRRLVQLRRMNRENAHFIGNARELHPIRLRGMGGRYNRDLLGPDFRLPENAQRDLPRDACRGVIIDNEHACPVPQPAQSQLFSQ